MGFQEVFDHQAFMRQQVIEALTCPVNRDMTRREHGCDDWALYRNPEWLVQHFARNGGAEAFAKHRAKYIREIPSPEYEI